ncbi:MAG TPA: cytochrome b/b6 domain-containing protein [Vicinamibacteria bacterium]|nr:cytochrome b/b6 domain-containing protein [Vicinamibacteria bacterium]
MSRHSDPRDLVVRFSRRQRVEHLVVMLLFLLLALTGFPQKFYDSSWSHWIVDAIGGIARVRWIHRTAGILFAIATVVHIATAIVAVATGRARLTLIPTRRDFRDAIVTLRYYLRLSETRAKFDRFDYREKFEYWGLVIGAAVMVSTGFVLYFPLAVTRWLPGELIPVAKVAHSNEGLMAFLVVLTWHIYNVHFAPEVFPFNTSIFTGRVTREHLKRDHPLEYARLFPEEADEVLGLTQEKPEPAANRDG